MLSYHSAEPNEGMSSTFSRTFSRCGRRQRFVSAAAVLRGIAAETARRPTGTSTRRRAGAALVARAVEMLVPLLQALPESPPSFRSHSCRECTCSA
jgi:hypothetical protein